MIERSIAFGTDGGLIGTVCLPPAAARNDKGVGQILFNAGVVHRVGPHRINVKLARSLAARGIASIRFDLSGLGDSARAAGNLPFEEQAVVDIRAAMDVLTKEADVDRFVALGYCSGGWHTYATALADPRLAGILMYDSYYYLTWRSRLFRGLSSIRRHGFSTAAGGWVRKLLSAPFNVMRRSGETPVAESARESPGLVRAPPKAEFAAGLWKIHDQGTRVAILYSGGSRHYTYRGQFEDAFADSGVTAFVHHEYVPAIGHTATELAALSILMQRIESWTLELDAACRERAAPPRRATSAAMPGGRRRF